MRQGRGLKQDQRGSATVEAAVVIPLTLSLVMLLVFFSLFLYNRAAAVSATGRALVLAAGMEQEPSGKVEKAMHAFLAERVGKMPLLKKVSHQGKASLWKASAHISLEGENNGFLLPLKGISLSFEDRRSIQRLDPARVIWTVRIAKDIAGKKEAYR